MTIVAGEHDAVVPPTCASRPRAAVAGAELEVLAGCGHLPPAEDAGRDRRPADRALTGRGGRAMQ